MILHTTQALSDLKRASETLLIEVEESPPFLFSTFDPIAQRKEIACELSPLGDSWLVRVCSAFRAVREKYAVLTPLISDACNKDFACVCDRVHSLRADMLKLHELSVGSSSNTSTRKPSRKNVRTLALGLRESLVKLSSEIRAWLTRIETPETLQAMANAARQPLFIIEDVESIRQSNTVRARMRHLQTGDIIRLPQAHLLIVLYLDQHGRGWFDSRQIRKLAKALAKLDSYDSQNPRYAIRRTEAGRRGAKYEYQGDWLRGRIDTAEHPQLRQLLKARVDKGFGQRPLSHGKFKNSSVSPQNQGNTRSSGESGHRLYKGLASQ